MTVFWCAALVIFIVIEVATVGLASIWFAIGAFAALIAAALSAPLWLQITLFIAVSAASLALTRPLVAKRLAIRRSATNFDRVLQMAGTVTEEINNIASTGTVHVDGKDWTARSIDGCVIPVGSIVKAECIEGVKLLVHPVNSVPPCCAAASRTVSE